MEIKELKAPSTENVLERINYCIGLCDEITSICKGNIDIGGKETVPPIQKSPEVHTKNFLSYFQKLKKILILKNK